MESSPRFLFVGERPSQRASQIGATWQNGKLSAKNLREAIEAAGMDPAAQQYLNLYELPTPNERDACDAADVAAACQRAIGLGYEIVAMGALVSRVLTQYGVPHRRLTHPAARGAIRKTETYRAHVREVLLGEEEVTIHGR